MPSSARLNQCWRRPEEATPPGHFDLDLEWASEAVTMSRTQIPRWQIHTILAAALVLGGLHGASTAWSTSPSRIAPDVAAAPPVLGATSTQLASPQDPLRGRFWRPVDSNATRPEKELRPRGWSPWPVVAAPDEFTLQAGERG